MASEHALRLRDALALALVGRGSHYPETALVVGVEEPSDHHRRGCRDDALLVELVLVLVCELVDLAFLCLARDGGRKKTNG